MHSISSRAKHAWAIPTQAFRALILVAALSAPAIPAAAQYSAIAQADPGAYLAGALRTLSSDPRNFQALIAAGRASLDMGDTQAAAGFYGRAEEVAPQSPVPKIGIGAAMTAMGDARGAMTYFDRASTLGSPQSLLALDRGLAFDLLGQQSKAQSDYRAAMFGIQADEARRRLALSLAISKDIKGAAAMLAPLLARRNAAAVRTNAFVLALGGDREGARRAIDAALPGAGARFEPFFRMLPMLRADEKAMAVHLGEFPKDAAQRYASAERMPSSPALSTGSKSAYTIGAPAQTPQVQITPPMNARAAQVQITPPKNAKATPVRVKVRQDRDVRTTEPPRRALREAAAPTVIAMSRPMIGPPRQVSNERGPEVATPASASKPAEPDPEPRPGFSTDDLAPIPEAAEPLVPINVGAVLNRDGEPILSAKAEAEPQPPPAPTPKLDMKPPPAPKPKVEVAKLDWSPAKAKSTPKAEADKPKETAKKKAETDKLKDTAKKQAEADKRREAAKKKAPASPYFVQLASGANADRMGYEYKKIKAKKPALFAGRHAQVTNGKDLFRLVVGPFKSRDDSGEFVNQLAKAGIDGFSYTAPDGMTFEKIATQ